MKEKMHTLNERKNSYIELKKNLIISHLDTHFLFCAFISSIT